MMVLTLLCLALTAVDQPVALEVAQTVNLLSNSSFEEGGATPSWWGRYPGRDEDGNRHLRDATTGHTGHCSALIDAVTEKPAGKPPVQWSKYDLPVEGGTTLIASFWIKSDGCSPGYAGVHFYAAQRVHLGFVKIPGPREAKDWTAVRQAVPVPPEAVSFGFVLYAHQPGRTWFDDAVLLQTPSTAAVRTTPTVDGKLDEPCWSPDRAIQSFVVLTGDKLPADPISAWTAFDDDALYVAFRCPYPKGAKLLLNATQHDGTTWLDDSLEVYLDPGRQFGDYYQFCVNAAGVLRDQRGKDERWSSGATAATVRGDDVWTCELRIPFEKLGIGLEVKDRWGLNLVRNDRTRGETSTWSLGGFHEPRRFGTVTLEPDLSRHYADSVGRRLDRLAERQDSFRQELQASGLGPEVVQAAQDELARSVTVVKQLDQVSESGRAPAGWDDARAKLAAAEAAVVSAREAAVKVLYGAQGGQAFHLVIADSLSKVRRDGDILEGLLASRVRLDAAGDEAESFQLVVVPDGQDLSGVTVDASALKGPGGEVPLRWHRVGYVETSQPKYVVDYVGWWPDPLYPAGPFDVSAGQRQPLWLTAEVPADQLAGEYQGTVTVSCGDAKVAVPVTLRVRDFTLPRPGALATSFGLYAWVLSGWYHKEAYQQAMKPEVFQRWCAFLNHYRLTAKNIGREYTQLKPTDDGYEADLAPLDETVKPLLAEGLDPRGFSVYRLPSGPSVKQTGDQTDTDDWAARVKAYDTAWRQRGLPEGVFIYGVDEPHPEMYPILQEAYRKVKAVAPQYPIMQTIGDPHPDALVGLVDIWCPLTARADQGFYHERQRAGDTFWTYICCSPHPPYANFFIDQPATDHRVLFWQVKQLGATGLLYWCVCWWYGAPNAVSGQPHFPDVPFQTDGQRSSLVSHGVNGDGLLVYPGPDETPWPSLRLEIVRDGIEDYEYLALLDRLVAEADRLPAAQRPKELLARAKALQAVPESISQSMTEYTKESRLMIERRRQVAEVIEGLSAAVQP